ncbi:nucleoporin fg repeat [Cystoisospora suis]|uniref:Nucleoporin fg repeat n=1 Tax=Cystoisospora suis TaxID=483139 RepID=A0A2C6L587_9APIC|nr:nucleoporin fg repeat [Cystoisospora suis]
MQQSLLEVRGGGAALRPVSYLERAASWLPSTSRCSLSSSSREASGESAWTNNSRWRSFLIRTERDLEGSGGAILTRDGSPLRRFTIGGGNLTGREAGVREMVTRHQRDGPFYREFRAPGDPFLFTTRTTDRRGRAGGAIEDEGNLGRYGPAIPAVPSTFHQRGIFLMAKICHDFVSAFANLHILIPLSHTYPPPPSFFLPGCKCCCHRLPSNLPPPSCTDSQGWCNRVSPVTAEEYVEVLSENAAPDPICTPRGSSVPRLVKDSERKSPRKIGGGGGLLTVRNSPSVMSGQHRLSPDMATASKGNRDSSAERLQKTSSGQDPGGGRRRSISTEEGRSASSAPTGSLITPYSLGSREGSRKEQTKGKARPKDGRRGSVDKECTASARSTEVTARAKAVSMEEAKRTLRGQLLPTVQEIAETLGALLTISEAMARILEELPRLDRRIFCAVLTASGRRLLPLSLSLRCEGPAAAQQRSSSSSSRSGFSRVAGGAGDLWHGSADTLAWPRSPTPGTASPHSVCDHRTGGARATGAISPSGQCSRGRSLERDGARLFGASGTVDKNAARAGVGGPSFRDGGSVVSLHKGEGCASTDRPAPTLSVTASSLGRQRAERRRGARQRIRRGSPTLTTLNLRRISESHSYSGVNALPRGYAFSIGGALAQPTNGLLAGNAEEELQCVSPDLLVQEALWELMRNTVEKAVKVGAEIVNAFVAQNVLRAYAEVAKKFLLMLIHLGQVSLPSASLSFLPLGLFPPASGLSRRPQPCGNSAPRNRPGRVGTSYDAGAQEEKRDEEGLAETDPSSEEFYCILLQYVLQRYGVDERLADVSADKPMVGPLLLLHPGEVPQH